jgi:hypothetical protein
MQVKKKRIFACKVRINKFSEVKNALRLPDKEYETLKTMSSTIYARYIK